jgi:Tfp pilus assembly protein PilX
MKIENCKLKITSKKSPGQILIVGIIFMAVILILSATLFSRVANYIHFNSNDITREQATNLAEAGLEKALWQLNQTAGSYTGEANTALGTTGTFTVQITPKSSNVKTVTVTGYVPNSTNPRAKRTIKTDAVISDTIIAFNYGVQVGTSGLNMGQSSQVVGSVYSNKTGTSITGNLSSTITGDAWAVGTISNPPSVPPGKKHENQSPTQMPAVDYQYWKDTATVGGVIDCTQTPSACNLTGSGTAIIGNKKYLGNLTLGQSKVVTMNGPVYVTGNLDMGQSSRINLDNSYGSNSTVLILDGTIDIGQSAQINPTNATPKGYIMLVTTTTDTIDISQSGVNAIFYALNATVSLGQSTHATAIIAKGLTLGQSTILTYDNGLASTDFSSGPGGSWAIKKGTYRFTQ